MGNDELKKGSIFETLISRSFPYVHVIEVKSTSEIENIIDAVYMNWKGEYTVDEIAYYLATLTVYSLSDKNENEIYDFDIVDSFMSNMSEHELERAEVNEFLDSQDIDYKTPKEVVNMVLRHFECSLYYNPDLKRFVATYATEQGAILA